jgi:hypothetical protein
MSIRDRAFEGEDKFHSGLKTYSNSLDFRRQGGRITSITSDPIQDRMGR